jgi:hypothetical protein
LKYFLPALSGTKGRVKSSPSERCARKRKKTVVTA